MAKEIVVSTLSVLHNVNNEEDDNISLQTKLREQKYTSGPKEGQFVLTPVVAYAFMLFVLLYFPCIATILTIRKELGTKWAVFVAIYNTAVAWVVAFGFYQVGSLFV